MKPEGLVCVRELVDLFHRGHKEVRAIRRVFSLKAILNFFQNEATRERRPEVRYGNQLLPRARALLQGREPFDRARYPGPQWHLERPADLFG
jgi:hypothetical protein